MSDGVRWPELSALPPGQRRILETLQALGASLDRATVGAVARQAGVSPSSVVRFANRLGLEGFTDLRYAMSSGQGDRSRASSVTRIGRLAGRVLALCSDPDATGIVAVDGPVGSGRTWLLRIVARQAAAQGAQVVTVQPDTWAEDLAAADRLADAGRDRLLVVVDDSDQLDREAANRLIRLATHRPHSDVRVVLGTGRGWHGGPLASLVLLAAFVPLVPLTVDEVGAAIADRHGRAVGEATARRVTDATGGRAGFVAAVLDEMSLDDIENPAVELRVRDIAGIVLPALAHSGSAADVLLLLAVAGQPLPLGVLRVASGADLDALAHAVTSLEEIGVATFADNVVQLTPPVVGATVRGSSPAAAVARAHGRLVAALLRDPTVDHRDLVRHAAAAGDLLPVQVAAELAALAPVLVRADPQASATWLGQLSVTGSGGWGRSPANLAVLATALARCGEGRRLADLLQRHPAIVEHLADPGAVFEVAMSALQWSGRMEELTDLVARVSALGGSAGARADLVAAWLEVTRLAPVECAAHLEALYAVLTDPVTRPRLALQVGVAHGAAGDGAAARAWFASAGAMLPDSAAVHVTLARFHALAGELASTRRELTMALALASGMDCASVARVEEVAAYIAGDLPTVLRFDPTNEPTAGYTTARAVHAMAAVEAWRPAEPLGAGVLWEDGLHALAGAHLSWQRGDLAATRRMLAAAADVDRVRGVAFFLPLLADAQLTQDLRPGDLVPLERGDRRVVLVDECAAIAERLATPYHAHLARFGRALQHASATELADAVDDAVQHGFRLREIRARLYLGVLARDGGELRRAAELATQVEAEVLGLRIDAAMRALGVVGGTRLSVRRQASLRCDLLRAAVALGSTPGDMARRHCLSPSSVRAYVGRALALAGVSTVEELRSGLLSGRLSFADVINRQLEI